MKKLVASISLLFFLAGCDVVQSTVSPSNPSITEKSQAAQEIQPQQNHESSTATVKYYNNVDGEKVQSPTYYPSEPVGATARCRDGTYSFSRHRSGTCSHHGGVEEWL